jgi:hypothetical protein
MSQRFRSSVERGEYRIRRFTTWLISAYPLNTVCAWTLTLPSGKRSKLVSGINVLWNNLTSNFLSAHKSVYGWARFLELHANGVPHFHVLLITRNPLNGPQFEHFKSELNRAALNSGFGPKMHFAPVLRTPSKAARYVNKQAILARMIGRRPESLVSARLFSSSKSIRADFKGANPKGISRPQLHDKLAYKRMEVARKGIGGAARGWFLNETQTRALFALPLAQTRPSNPKLLRTATSKVHPGPRRAPAIFSGDHTYSKKSGKGAGSQ